jgi:hypothetical protein
MIKGLTPREDKPEQKIRTLAKMLSPQLFDQLRKPRLNVLDFGCGDIDESGLIALSTVLSTLRMRSLKILGLDSSGEPKELRQQINGTDLTVRVLRPFTLSSISGIPSFRRAAGFEGKFDLISLFNPCPPLALLSHTMSSVKFVAGETFSSKTSTSEGEMAAKQMLALQLKRSFGEIPKGFLELDYNTAVGTFCYKYLEPILEDILPLLLAPDGILLLTVDPALDFVQVRKGLAREYRILQEQKNAPEDSISPKIEEQMFTLKLR